MLLTMLVLTTTSLSWALPGWREVGPERGHVVDAAVGPGVVSVATRVGVLASDPSLQGWHRDARFPPEIRRLAYAPDGTVWAAPAGHLWRLDAASTHIAEYPQSTVVDLRVTAQGTAIAALRGARHGVLRYGNERGEPVLPQVDPWCLAVDGERVLVGTLQSGVWLSADDGQTFRQLGQDQPVSAVGWAAGEPWVGLADGQILSGAGLVPQGSVAPGRPIAFAAVTGGVLLAVDDEHRGDHLVLADPSGLVLQQMGRVDEDRAALDLTGLWSLPGGAALVGSFRRGPLLWSRGSLRPARQGFRATITGGAVLDDRGRLLLALMGTGVYSSVDATRSWQPQHGGPGPVTDSVAVVALPGGIAVVDFDGLAFMDAGGGWSRLMGLGARGSQDMIDVAVDGGGRWWAVDRQGGLWLSREGAWRRCATRGALRLDGSGAELLLASAAGYRVPGSCDEAWRPLPYQDNLPPFKPMEAQAAGGWIAMPGQLWRDGRRVAALPDDGVACLGLDGGGVLLALQGGTVLACDPTCQQAAMPLLQPAVAIGRLPDGRLWAAEKTGTLLVSGGDSVPPPWSRLGAGVRRHTNLTGLERAPWSQEGKPVQDQPGPQRPHPIGSGQAPVPTSPTRAAALAAPEPSTAPQPPLRRLLPWLLAAALGVALLAAIRRIRRR